MKRFFLFVFLATLLLSCSIDDNNTNYSFKTLPVKSAVVPSEFTRGQTYKITVTYDLLNGCQSFYSLIYQHENNARLVAINAIESNDRPCTEALIEKTYEFNVRASQREDYVFKFWKGKDAQGNNIFEEITVPVKP